MIRISKRGEEGSKSVGKTSLGINADGNVVARFDDIDIEMEPSRARKLASSIFGKLRILAKREQMKNQGVLPFKEGPDLG